MNRFLNKRPEITLLDALAFFQKLQNNNGIFFTFVRPAKETQLITQPELERKNHLNGTERIAILFVEGDPEYIKQIRDFAQELEAKIAANSNQ